MAGFGSVRGRKNLGSLKRKEVLGAWGTRI